MLRNIVFAFLLLVCLTITVRADDDHEVRKFEKCEFPLETVPFLDLVRYSGLWFQIATTKTILESSERHCHHCVTSTFTPFFDVHQSKEKETQIPFLQITNTCRRRRDDHHDHHDRDEDDFGELRVATGRLDIPDPFRPGQLVANFHPTFLTTRPNYFIITLGSRFDYEFALIGEPCRRGLFILARVPEIRRELFDYLKKVAEEHGFDRNEIVKTDNRDCFEHHRHHHDKDN